MLMETPASLAGMRGLARLVTKINRASEDIRWGGVWLGCRTRSCWMPPSYVERAYRLRLAPAGPL